MSRSKRLWSMAVVTPSFERAVMKNSNVALPAGLRDLRRAARGVDAQLHLPRRRGPAARAVSCRDRPRELLHSRVEHVDVVRDVVGRGVAGAQHDRQRARRLRWRTTSDGTRNPALKCAAAPALFSECTSTSVESMSRTTAADPPCRRGAPTQRRAQTPQQPKATEPPRGQARSVRYSVESDATCPNSTGWARRCSMSLHASPPPASINNA